MVGGSAYGSQAVSWGTGLKEASLRACFSLSLPKPVLNHPAIQSLGLLSPELKVVRVSGGY